MSASGARHVGDRGRRCGLSGDRGSWQPRMGSASDNPLAEVSTAAVERRRDRESAAQARVPALTVAAHPNADRVSDRLLLSALAAGQEVHVSRNAPVFVRPGGVVGAPLIDPFISRKAIRFVPGKSGRISVIAGEGGTQLAIGGAVQNRIEVAAEDLERGVPIEVAERVLLLFHFVDLEAEDAPEPLGMVGHSAGIRRVRTSVERIADLHVPVLIRGETGSGKELVARAIHQKSPRRDGPFISVNLGAVPRELAAAELFGSQKGAFTGATRDREGFFGAARGGTLFLDEVAEAPPEVQVMLLRVLETGEMFPVGAHAPASADVRLIAATDADLEAHIRDGRFRAPLHHRLAGYEIDVPSLRERREDIGLLFYHFAREDLETIGELKRLSPEDPYAPAWVPANLAAQLVRYGWPGNIRQLRNVTRQLVIGGRGQARLPIDPRLAAELDTPAAPLSTREPSTAGDAPDASRRTASEVGEAELLAALKAQAWDIKATADRLGIPRSSIYDLIDKSPNIRTAGDLAVEEIEAAHRACEGDLDEMAERLQVSKKALGRRAKELGLKPKRGGKNV